jgi:hypothetical protein
MKKIIDEKKSLIKYVGNFEELKDQLKYLIESHPEFKNMFNEKDFEKFSSYGNSPQTLYERLDYNPKEILYGPNGSANKFKFFKINHYSKLADEKFIKKYSKNSLEIITKS